MPGTDGMEATVLIKAQVLRTQVVILTAFWERDSKWTAELMGAAGLLDKDAPLDVLVKTSPRRRARVPAPRRAERRAGECFVAS